MKKSLWLLALLFLTFALIIPVSAFANWGNQKDKTKHSCEKCDKEKKAHETADTAKAVVSSPPPPDENSRRSIHGLTSKSDSSSVLSYNFIFYLVYKFKYSASDEGVSKVVGSAR